MTQPWKLILAGALAGAVNGLLGAGGGMILVPILSVMGMEQEEIFSTSVAIIFPICFVSLLFSQPVGLPMALPYLLGGMIGGALAFRFGKKIPVKWLHRIFGILVLYGGIRYLC